MKKKGTTGKMSKLYKSSRKGKKYIACKAACGDPEAPQSNRKVVEIRF